MWFFIFYTKLCIVARTEISILSCPVLCLVCTLSAACEMCASSSYVPAFTELPSYSLLCRNLPSLSSPSLPSPSFPLPYLPFPQPTPLPFPLFLYYFTSIQFASPSPIACLALPCLPFPHLTLPYHTLPCPTPFP